ncbi:MAG: alpha/beta hydrolase [Pseudomonadota bacterium]
MSKPPLILLHAALGSASQLAPLAACLADRFDVATMDFPGHGEAGPVPERFDYDQFARAVLETMDARGIDSAPVFGHSMGGYVGLYLAVHHPARIAAVHTLGTYFAWTPEAAAETLAELDADLIERKVPRFAQMLADRHVAGGWRTVLGMTAALIERTGASPPLGWDALARVEQRVRVGVGDRDHLTSVAAMHALYRALPNGEMAVFPGMGHAIERAPLALLAGSIAELASDATGA